MLQGGVARHVGGVAGGGKAGRRLQHGRRQVADVLRRQVLQRAQELRDRLPAWRYKDRTLMPGFDSTASECQSRDVLCRRVLRMVGQIRCRLILVLSRLGSRRTRRAPLAVGEYLAANVLRNDGARLQGPPALWQGRPSLRAPVQRPARPSSGSGDTETEVAQCGKLISCRFWVGGRKG